MRFRNRSVVLLIAAIAFGTAAAQSGPSSPETPVRLEVLKFANPSSIDESWSRTAPQGESTGKPGRAVYLLVVHLGPQQRFVSARIQVRDGLFLVGTKRRPAWIAGRIVGRVASHILAPESPAAVHGSILELSELITREELDAEPDAPRFSHRLALESKDVEHHEEYVTATVELLSGPRTRLLLLRIVTRATQSRERRKFSLPPVRVPGPDEPGLSDAALMEILLGRAGPVGSTESERREGSERVGEEQGPDLRRSRTRCYREEHR